MSSSLWCYILSDNHIAALQPVCMAVDNAWYIGAWRKFNKRKTEKHN